MGTIAARDCLRSMELTEQVTAACVLASAQALELRLKNKELSEASIGPSVMEFKNSVLSEAAFVEQDRALDKDLRHLIELIRNRKWKLYL